MQSAYELFIGLRYTRAGRRTGRRDGFISFISALSVAGIGLGVAALIVVLSVMNGFQKEVRDRMLSVLSHVEVYAGRAPLLDWRSTVAQARREPEVRAGAPFVVGQAMLTHEDVVRGVVVRGIEPAVEPEVADFARRLEVGSLEALRPGAFGIVVGRDLASQLLLAVGDRLTILAPQATATPAGVIPRLRAFTVVGIFRSGHYEYDSTLLLTHVEDAAKLFRVEGVSGVRLRLADMMQAPEVARRLSLSMGADYLVRDWSRENRNWFAAVKIEKRMMFIILMLIVAVAAFNLVSMLVMTVTDKLADIAILRTMGASPGSIMRIFMVQGASIGLLGTVAGVAIGVLLAANVGTVMAAVERAFGFEVLPKGVYFINYLPSDLHAADVALIGACAAAMSLLATVYPSWRAARVQPAEALRHE